MDGRVGLGLAFGHVRNATSAFWAAEDPSGECLFLSAECLDVEGLFSELGVVPELVETPPDPVVSLERASAALEAVRPAVPLAVWAAVQVLRAKASR